MNESGKWHPGANERQLAHIEGNNVRAAYARGEHWNELVSMMQNGGLTTLISCGRLPSLVRQLASQTIFTHDILKSQVVILHQ